MNQERMKQLAGIITEAIRGRQDIDSELVSIAKYYDSKKHYIYCDFETGSNSETNFIRIDGKNSNNVQVEVTRNIRGDRVGPFIVDLSVYSKPKIERSDTMKTTKDVIKEIDDFFAQYDTKETQ